MPGFTGRRWSGRGPARCALRASRPDGRRAGVGISVTCHSVGCGAGQGTYNYVVFDPELIEILKRNGEPIKGLLGE